MPDLGKYALEVGLAYGISAVLIAGLVVISVLRARRVAQQVEKAEVRRG
ncbi:Heme exporter protein D (CcmD) [Rhodobacteraceae bacterium THAF1]|nr:heme exporter protein CcmD [Palleronia sp. THAF1]QFU09003.1 Heme exporter protein D (CcmD) [Palleronia sp. THAF1]VDC24258.1 Heme exporter protein D (CcmD) [Rhodobacteraceae bacterium THAF1]